jgi:hypothetical protein
VNKLDRSWKKSSRSGTGSCVEVRLAETGDIQVRDSKDPDSSVLTFAPAEWGAFIAETKAGDLSF